jgi:muramidase (phage lysozyme)
MARAPVRQIERSAQLRPVAEPVDTFVQPKRSNLRDLAQSLSGFNESLQGYFEAERVRKAQDDDIKGKAAAYSDGAEEIATAVRDNKVPSQYSPNFVAAFKRARGELAGGDLQTKFNAAFQQWPGKDQLNNEAGFNKFFTDFLHSNVSQDADPDTLRGMLPQLQELEQASRAQFIAYQNKRLHTEALDASTAAASQDVQKALDAGRESEDGADYGKIMQGPMLRRAAHLAVGGNPEEFDNALMDSMSAMAIQQEDPQLLDAFLKTKVPGTDHTYGETPEGIKLDVSTKNSLREIAGRQLTAQAEQEKLLMKKRHDEAVVGIVQSLTANPEGEVPEALLQTVERNGDPIIRTRLTEWRKNLQTGGSSDPAALLDITRQMIQHPEVDPMTYVRKGLDNNVFKSSEDLEKASRFAQSVKDNKDLVRTTLDSQTVRSYMTRFANSTSAIDDFGNPIHGISNEGLEAQYDYKQQVMQFVLQHPEEAQDPVALEKRLNEIGRGITDRLKPNPDSTDGSEMIYNRDPALEESIGPNPQSAPTPTEDGTPAATPEAQPTSQPNGAPAGGKATPEQVQKFINSLDPQQRETFQRNATQNGFNLNQGVQKYLDSKPEARPISYNPNDDDLGEGDQRAGGLTPQLAEGFINEALASTGGDQAENLLNLVSNGEGTKGNYNAVFGDGGQSSIDLGQYTVDDILAQQQWARQNGYPSTAIGKYQLIYKTLASLKADGTVSGDEKFSPEVQERAGRALLDRRGYQQFLAGKLSKRAFALRLSQEWASLPNPSTGRSFYAGDRAGNASHVSPTSVYDALGLTPASYGANEYDGNGLTFDHPEQAAGVRSELKGIVASSFQELGLDNAEVISGYRSPDHPAERDKADGGGEHTHGSAMDVSLRGLDDSQRAALVNKLREKGAKRFITYSKYPDMLHVDLKDQTGNGSAYYMHNKSAKNMSKAPQWFKDVAGFSSI